jgi:hypothetical protein
VRVRMLTSVAGEAYSLEEGREYDLPDDQARVLVAEPADYPRAEPVAVKPADRRQTRGASR